MTFHCKDMEHSLTALFIVMFLFGLAVGFTLGIIVMAVPASAQESTSPTPITITPDPSALNFLEQDAYIQTVPPAQVQVQQQQQASSGNGALDSIIPAIVASAGSFIMGKISSDKKTKKVADVVQHTVLPEQVKSKETQKELARVTYDMNPEAAAKIDDAPAVKIQTLTEDSEEFAQKAASTAL
jgi:hypothetical protein